MFFPFLSTFFSLETNFSLQPILFFDERRNGALQSVDSGLIARFNVLTDVPTAWYGDYGDAPYASNDVYDRLVLTPAGTGISIFDTLFDGRDTTRPFTIQTKDALRGNLVLYERYNSNGTICSNSSTDCSGWGTCWGDGFPVTVTTCTWPAMIPGEDISNFALRLSSATDVPIHVWVRLGEIYIRVNSNLQGTGTWTETKIISKGHFSESFAQISFEVLSTGGYGLFAEHMAFTGSGYDYNYTFYYTADTSGTTGWSSGDVLYTEDTSAQLGGVLGIDGLGMPYIVATGNPMVVYTNANAAGSGAWSIATTIDLPNTTLPNIDKDRAIVLTNDKPVFACRHGLDTYAVQSTNTSAAGPWSAAKVSITESVGLMPDSLSINFSNASIPHIIYINFNGTSEYNFMDTRIVRAADETGFNGIP
jgi:hypothetical protein